jgi:hypothetical protein
LISFASRFRGEIKDLFEKVTKDELEKSIASGDQKKQQHMLHLIQGLPYHSEEIEKFEELSRKTATTESPREAPEIPDELKKLLSSYGLLDTHGNPVHLAPLPVADNADHPSSLLFNDNIEIEPVESVEELQHKIRQAALVDPKDYENFKPITGDSANMTSDMEAFLKQYGLLEYNENYQKNQKPIKSAKFAANSAIPSIDAAYLVPGYSTLLDNIGITTIKDKNGKKASLKPSSNNFKPVNKNKAGEEDYKKLEQLLETIRELERLNASLTEKEVEKLNLNNFNLSESLLAAGPDPLSYHIQFSALKNEVKRQTDEPTRVSLALGSPLLESSLEATEDSNDNGSDNESIANGDKKQAPSPTTTAKPSTTTEEPKTTTTTTEEPSSVTEEERKNSLEDEIEPVEDPEPLPPPRRSGFYALFDWNSFLEVGEDPDKISVRFDPKIGDPSRFLPISVP